MSDRTVFFAASVGLACVLASGCDLNQQEPLSSSLTSANEDESFYFYQGNRIRLEANPLELVVAGPVGLSVATVAEVAAEGGVSVRSISPLPQDNRHFLVALAPGTAPETLRSLSQKVRTDTRLGFASPAYKVVDDGSRILLLNRLVVQFRKGVPRPQIDSLVSAIGASILREPRPDSALFDYYLAYPTDSNTNPLQVAAFLDRHPLVEWADPDRISEFRLWSPPNDAYYGLQWNLKSTILKNGVPVDIAVEQAWQITTGNGVVRVAVLDDGVDSDHPDICGIAGGTGWDAFTGFADNVYVPHVNDAHGTHIVGQIMGCRDNTIGIAGIIPNAKLYPARIFRNGQPTSVAQIANAIT